MATINNKARNTASITNNDFGAIDLTWAEATFPWDEAGGTWGTPGNIVAVPRNTASITNNPLS